MLEIRAVRRSDFIQVIEMLQDISNFYPKNSDLESVWKSFSSQENVKGFCYFLDGKLIGYGSFVQEIKIRGGKVAHIEDIVVDKSKRGLGLGKEIIENLKQKALEIGCYKVILSCKEENIEFYDKCNFEQTGYTMTYSRTKL
jgi:GNAT superfamily N-acetyltransferase